MDDRVVAAADNNARWCDLVCRSHGIPTAIEESHWVALRRPPAPFPDVATLVAGATPADVLRSAHNGAGSTVTDSFADLDLQPLGFEEVLQAQWLCRGPVLPTVIAAEVWSVVDTAEELAAWALAAKAPEAFGEELLREPALRILAARSRDGIQAGAIVYRTERVAGLWNVFAKPSMPDYKAWASLPTAVAGQCPWTPIVGLAHGQQVLSAVMTAGFAETGPLRVWQRPGSELE